MLVGAGLLKFSQLPKKLQQVCMDSAAKNTSQLWQLLPAFFLAETVAIQAN